METDAIRKPFTSKPNRTPSTTKAIAFRQRNSDRPVTHSLTANRNSTMLTQTRPLNSTSVVIDRHPNSFGVLLAGNLIGNVETYPVWGLDGSAYDTAKALGLKDSDEAFIFNNRPYSTIEQATAMVIGEHLSSTATWALPDYM
jgi:hypothetical protein